MIKKILSLLISLLLLGVILVTPALAVGEINTYEQSILTKLEIKITVEKSNVIIPKNYINQAKAYFMTVDVSEEEAAKINAIIDEGISVTTAALKKVSKNGKVVTNMKDFVYADKAKILQLGKDACAVIGLTLTYNPSNNTVVITENSSGKTVFDAAPILKITGGNGSFIFIYISLAVLATALIFAAVYKKRETEKVKA